MKAVLILLSASTAFFLASLFCRIAALLAEAGSSYADMVGYSGLGISAVVFVVMSIASWRIA